MQVFVLGNMISYRIILRFLVCNYSKGLYESFIHIPRYSYPKKDCIGSQRCMDKSCNPRDCSNHKGCYPSEKCDFGSYPGRCIATPCDTDGIPMQIITFDTLNKLYNTNVWQYYIILQHLFLR